MRSLDSVLACFLLLISPLIGTVAHGQTNPRTLQAVSPPGIDLNAAARHLAAAVQLRTVSYDGHDTANPATLDAFRDFLERTYPIAHKAMSRRVLSHRALLFTWRGTETRLQPIILIAHMDVVPAEEQGEARWQYPAFSGTIQDGAVWGRGSIDMKGQLIAIFEAIEALARNGFLPARTIYIGLGSNEETSGTGARGIARTLKTAGVHADFILDEGPVILDPFALTRKRAAFIGVAEKGYGTLLVRAFDTSGHSAVPSSDPGLERLARAIHAIDTMPIKRDIDATDLPLLKMIGKERGGFTMFAVSNLWLFKEAIDATLVRIPAGVALLGTTIAPTMASGSAKENELPAVATARINVRLHPRDTAKSILAEARRATASIRDVSIDWAAQPDEASRVSSTQSRAYRLLLNSITRLGGSTMPVVPVLLPGQTDSRSYADVAENAYLFQPYVLTEDEVEEIHGRNEHLSLDNIKRAITFFYDFIPEAAKSAGIDQ